MVDGHEVLVAELLGVYDAAHLLTGEVWRVGRVRALALDTGGGLHLLALSGGGSVKSGSPLLGLGCLGLDLLLALLAQRD